MTSTPAWGGVATHQGASRQARPTLFNVTPPRPPPPPPPLPWRPKLDQCTSSHRLRPKLSSLTPWSLLFASLSPFLIGAPDSQLEPDEARHKRRPELFAVSSMNDRGLLNETSLLWSGVLWSRIRIVVSKASVSPAHAHTRSAAGTARPKLN